MDLYTPLVQNWLIRAGVRGADIEDLSQEVFRALVTGLADFRRDRPGDSFRAWLYGITRHRFLKHFDRAGRTPQASGGTDAHLRLQQVAESETTDDQGAGDKQALYQRALDLVRGRFEEKTWEAFRLVVIESYSPDEVASRLGISPAAVRKHKSRILHCLRTEIGDLID